MHISPKPTKKAGVSKKKKPGGKTASKAKIKKVPHSSGSPTSTHRGSAPRTTGMAVTIRGFDDRASHKRLPRVIPKHKSPRKKK